MQVLKHEADTPAGPAGLAGQGQLIYTIQQGCSCSVVAHDDTPAGLEWSGRFVRGASRPTRTVTHQTLTLQGLDRDASMSAASPQADTSRRTRHQGRPARRLACSCLSFLLPTRLPVVVDRDDLV
jgi:hypothetical protein